MNYEELVKELRETERICRDRMDGEVMLQAADAIEELQQTVEHYKGCADDWYKEACDYKAIVPKWIPVTERLPPVDEDVLVWAYNSMTRIWTLCRLYYETADVYWECEDGTMEEVPVVTHWMPLPEPPKEEV